MKKNFLTAAAIMVTAFFVGTEVAKAADVTFGGQILNRFEINEQNGTPGFSDASEADDFMQSRVRLNANVNVNDSTSAFIQLQSARTWGNGVAANASTFGTNGPGGSGNSSLSGSDEDGSVGLHQAYFTLKNFASLPVDLQMGRQEVVLDGHRLFGNTGWTIGAQTHDAIRLTHKHDNMTLVYAFIKAREGNRADDPNDEDDVDAHLAYFQYAGILGGNFSALVAYVIDDCGTAGTVIATGGCTQADNNSWTVGGRQAGQLFGIDYRGEFYYQGGDAAGDAASLTNATSFPNGTGVSGDVDRKAYMFGVRIGKSFNNVMLKPSLTLWYDKLSGTSDKDAREGDYQTFDTLFDTGHKFYGLMDLYTGDLGGGTDALGLQDIAIKATLSPMPGWTFKADYHWFYTAKGIASNTGATGAGAGGTDSNSLGNELDLTLVNKYNANTNISIGYSNYTTSSGFRLIRGAGAVGSDDANWAYVQFDVKF